MRNREVARWSKMTKKYNAMAPRIEIRVAKRYGDVLAHEIAEKSRLEFEKVVLQMPEIPGRLNIFREIIEINAIAIAFHKALRSSGVTVDEAAEIFYETVSELHQAIPKPIRWIIGWFFTSPVFLKVAQHSSKQSGKSPDGWKIEYRRGTDERCDLYFEATECAVLKFYEKVGVSEMGAYCNFVDYIQSEVFNLGMRQPAHLGSGDIRCVECFKRGRPTEVPDNLRKLVMNQQISKSA